MSENSEYCSLHATSSGFGCRVQDSATCGGYAVESVAVVRFPGEPDSCGPLSAVRKRVKKTKSAGGDTAVYLLRAAGKPAKPWVAPLGAKAGLLGRCVRR